MKKQIKLIYKFIYKNTSESKIIFIFYVIFFILINIKVLKTGHVFTYDTHSYLSVYTNVQPGYTIFLKIIRIFFGTYYVMATIYIQLILSFFTIIYFCEFIRKYFKFNLIVTVLLFLIVSYPIYSEYSMCNKLVTKSIATVCFLFTLIFIIKWFFLKKDFYLYLAIISTISLQLIRAQFLSVSIAIALFVFYEWEKKILLKKIGLVLLIISISVISSIVEKTVYGVFWGKYTSRQLGNVSIATLPFYLSEFEDFKLMPDNESKEFFLCAYTELKKKNLLASQLPVNSNLSEVHRYFFDNFPKIMNQTVEYEAKMMYNGEEESFAANYEYTTKIIGKTIKPLFLARPLEWFKVFYKNLAFAYFSIIPVVLLLLFVVYLFLKRNKNMLKYQSLLYFFSLLVLGNLFLISISTHTIRRFFMYFDVVIALIVMLVLCNNTSIKKYIQTN